MKVTRIEIKDFNQFKNLDIDLTYPKGHAKEGQPLDKVCFIGQSGTGKTTLLELIPKFITNYNTNLFTKLHPDSIHDKIYVEICFGNNNEYFANINFSKTETGDNSDWFWDNESAVIFFDTEWENKIASKIIYFPANLRHEIDIDENQKIDSKKIIDFSKEKVANVWNLIMDDIKKYHEEEIIIRQKISKIVEESKNNLEVIQASLKELEKWKKTEFNPVEDIAKNCLNTILDNFGLRVKTELDFKTKEDIGFINIEDFNKTEIPNGLWSTGTKQIVLSALPLYLLKPKNTVVLFDEPERSLYPDMQRMIIDFYSSLTKDSQFFYATHSPIIASSFEPWEIVELKLDENGHVYQELYYDAKLERHIDNYTIYPQYLDYDTMLRNVFDLKETVNQERIDKIGDALMYKKELKKMREQGDTTSDKFKKLYKDYKKLSEQLGYKGFEVF